MRISDRNDEQDNDPYFSPDGKTVTWNRNRLTRNALALLFLR